MSSIAAIVSLVGEIAVFIGVVAPIFAKMNRISNGTKCQLRSEMLRIYYHHRENGFIRQYEYENFVFLYEAYKVLGGNSFIDKIYAEVKKLEIVT